LHYVSGGVYPGEVQLVKSAFIDVITVSGKLDAFDFLQLSLLHAVKSNSIFAFDYLLFTGQLS
jgi:hypothetical protein